MVRKSLRPLAIAGVVCASLLIPPITIASPFVAVHYINNWTAIGYAQDVRKLPLPEDTEVLDSQWAAQRFAPAGNGIQYRGAILIRSSLSLEELAAHYEQVSEDTSAAIGVSPAARIDRRMLPFADRFDLAQPDLYVVIKYGTPSPGSFLELDLRGH